MHRKEINTITVEMFASDSVSVTSNEGHSFDAFGGKKKKMCIDCLEVSQMS